MDKNTKQHSITLEEMETALNIFTQTPIFKEVDFIIGISYGGVEVSEMLSEKLNIPMISLKHHHLPVCKFKRILIVDDIVDSGYTIKKFVDFYEKNNSVVNAFALYYNIDNVADMDVFYHVPLSEEYNPWIVFPWERGWNRFQYNENVL